MIFHHLNSAVTVAHEFMNVYEPTLKHTTPKPSQTKLSWVKFSTGGQRWSCTAHRPPVLVGQWGVERRRTKCSKSQKI